jgi:hypothetical protein
MDSFAGRIWFKPGESWEVQVSSGRLREPEELIGGDATRTTSTVSWFRESENGFSAIIGGNGVNEAHGTTGTACSASSLWSEV